MNFAAPPQSYQITHARVLAIAVPMTLSNATTPLLGVVATAVIGRLGQAHLLGAVAMSSVVFDCMFWLFSFLRMSTVALTAQALGRANVALALQIAINVTNAIAITILVVMLDLGVTGAALAAVVAEAVGTAFGLIVALRIVGARRPDIATIFDRARLIRLLLVNRDI